MLSIYAKQFSHLFTVREKESKSGVNMQGTVFTLTRLKIVPSYHQELVSHPMPEHIEALVINRFQTTIDHAGRVGVQCSLWTPNLQSFSIN